MISNNLRLFLHFHVSASAFKPFFDPLTWIKNHWQPMHCGMPGKRRVYSELVVVGQKKRVGSWGQIYLKRIKAVYLHSYQLNDNGSLSITNKDKYISSKE